MVQGVETTHEEWRPDALASWAWKRTNPPGGGLKPQYDVERNTNGSIAYQTLDWQNAVAQGFIGVRDTTRVQYDVAGNVRYH